MTVHSWWWLGVSPGKHQLCLMLHYTPSFRLVSVWPWNLSPPATHMSRTLPHCDLHKGQHILSAINYMPCFSFSPLFLIISVGLLEGACIILQALYIYILYSSLQQPVLFPVKRQENTVKMFCFPTVTLCFVLAWESGEQWLLAFPCILLGCWKYIRISTKNGYVSPSDIFRDLCVHCWLANG